MTLTDYQRRLLQYFWIAAMCLVISSELAPATSYLMRAVGTLHISDKVLHFCAYLLLSGLPAVSFANRRPGITTAVLMALLGIVLESGQHFSPGSDISLMARKAPDVPLVADDILYVPDATGSRATLATLG
jgi:hypothetical protein